MLSLYFSTVEASGECSARPGSLLCWTPTLATCAFFAGFGGGLGNLFWVLLAELVPPSRHHTTVPAVTFTLNALQFFILKEISKQS